MSRTSIPAVALVLVLVASGFLVATGNVAADKGDRDSYGYAWTDSKAPIPSVTFNWVEIRTTGTYTHVTSDDSYGTGFPIGFNFTFYGNRYTSFNVTTNGLLMFGGASTVYSNQAIPYSSTPNNFIALYWDDMDVDSEPQHGIIYETQGTAPDRQLVVEYLNFTRLSSSYNHMIAEIILKENGDIWLQYLSLSGTLGGSATIGIENSAGTTGCQYSCNQAVLEESLAIRFNFSPVAIGPSATQTGKPGTVHNYTLTVTNRMATDESFVITGTGIEGWPVVVTDSLGDALVDTDLDGLPDTGSIAANGGTATIHVSVTIPSSPSAPTEYTLVNASAHSNPLFYDVCVVTTEESEAWFVPPHTSYGVDLNSDGLYDTLNLTVSVHVRTAGYYTVYGYLYSPSGYNLGYQSDYNYYASGAQACELAWNGWPIRETADDGIYYVNLELYSSTWTLLDTDTHYTDYCYASDFTVRPAMLDPPHYDTPSDDDSDGLYETLTLHTNVTVNYDGLYRVTVYMYDNDWDYMLTNYTEVTLDAGARTVDLGFDSEAMRTSDGTDGPYHFSINLYGYVRGSWISLDSGGYTTPAYSASQFEAPDAFFQSPHDDYASDTDSDGYYDWLYVDVGVNVTVAGEYTVTGELYAWIYLIDTVSNRTYMDVGWHAVSLAFPGFPIRYQGDSDDFDLELTLMSETETLDTDEYTTDWYWWNDFETAPGWFVAPYESGVQDLDADGLYDNLLANVTVNVTASGTYEIYAELRDWTSDTICDATNRTYLSAGETVIHFSFPGWMIRQNGRDGSCYIYIYLYDEDGREMDSDSFSTDYYYYTDFQTLPAVFGTTGNTLYPRDDGTDGVNDTMVMEVNVTVDVAGYYYVYGTLYDNSWNVVGQERVLVWLPVGYDMVTIEFPGWLIHAIGVSGTFWCYSYLYDRSLNIIDSQSFNGGVWYNDFNSSVPRIVSSWATSTPTIDGVLPTGEWSAATVVDMSAAYSLNEVGAKLMVMNNGTHVFIALDVYTDTSDDSSDMSAIGFDTGNDDATSDGGEDEFNIYASGTESHYTYQTLWSGWRLDCSPFETAGDHAGLAAAAGFGTSPGYAFSHRIFEYSVPLTLLDAAMGDVLGFITRSHSFTGLEDVHNGTVSCWPLKASVMTLPTYGELALAHHVMTPPPVTAHSLAGTEGENAWYRSAVTATLTATGGDGGVDYTEYSLDNGSWTNYTAPLVVESNGTHTLQYRSVDVALQAESVKTVTFMIDQVCPVTAAAKSGTWVWLNSTDGHSGVASVTYRIDGGSWTTYTGGFNVSLGKGTHTVEYFATDLAGNPEQMKSITVEVTSGSGGGISGLLSNPILWIILIAAVAGVLVLLLVVARRKKGGQQPASYPGPAQPMPVQPQPDFPFQPGPPPSG